MNRQPAKTSIDAFFASASQVFCYYSWFVEVSPRLIESEPRRDELIHFHITEVAIAMGFLINLRSLDEFFDVKKKYPDDVRAYEFGFTSHGRFLSDLQRKQIDKNIAHPTEVPKDSKKPDYPTYAMAHQALIRVLQFIDFLLACAHPTSTPYGKSIGITRTKYLEFWKRYTDLVGEDERLPISG